jgi:mRNA-degrading endonuclease RelE of RelBE toxin-antitoxin system
MNIQIQESAIKDLKKIGKSISKKILHQIKNLENYPNISNIKHRKEAYQ